MTFAVSFWDDRSFYGKLIKIIVEIEQQDKDEKDEKSKLKKSLVNDADSDKKSLIKKYEKE